MNGQKRGGANLSEAFRRVTARPWLLLGLAGLNVGLTVVLTAPLSALLSSLLDLHPAAAVMVSGSDDGLMAELLGAHPEVLAVAAAALSAGAIVWGLLSWVLAGGVLAALALDGDRAAHGAAALLAESARRSGRMIKLGLFGLPLRLIPALVGGGGLALLRAIIRGRTFQPMSLAAMGALVLAAVAWATVTVAVDYARGLALDDTQTRSWRLVARGLKLAFVRRTATLQLIAFSIAAWLAVGVIYYWLAGHLSALLILTVLRLLSVVARTAITCTTFTAAARVARA
jgi:hypothetical protein